MSKLLELREKRDKLAEEIKRFAEKANDEKQDWSNEDQANYEKCNADFDAVSAELKAETDALDSRKQIAERNAAIQRGIADERQERRKIGRDDFRGRSDGQASGEITEEHRALALQAWFRAQTNAILTEEHIEACERVGVNPNAREFVANLCSRAPRSEYEARDLSAISGPAGAYTIPSGMLQPLERALLAFGGMRQAATVIRTTEGNVLPFPTSNDTSNTGALIGENTAVSEQDVTFAAVNLQAHKYSSKLVQVPVELLQDSAVNLPAFLGEILGERIGRIQNTHFTTGDGAMKPKGIVTAATLGKTAASATAITMDEVLDLVASVDPAYRPGASFMARDATIIALRKLKDGQGQYLWSKGDVTSGEPERLWGYPVITNQDVAAIATTAKTLLFGQFSRYKIRDVQSIRMRRLVERYADSDQEGFVAFMRSDGNLIDAGTNPVKYLQQA